MIGAKNDGEKQNIFSMERVAILDFMAVSEVDITLTIIMAGMAVV